jgi:hypothetical protein
MKKMSHFFITILAGAVMLASGIVAGGGACSSSNTTGTGGSSGSGGSGGFPPIPSGYVPLPSNATGFVDDTTGGSNVIGAWYAYGDGVGAGANTTTTDAANSDCQLKGGFPPSACSQIDSPVAGQPFPPADIAASSQCTSGTAAQVMNKGSSPDYSDLWGAGIGLDFNNPGGDAGVKGYIDLSKYKGIYFQFVTFPKSTTAPVSNGAGPPSMAMRVNFPFMGQHATDSPYWMGATKMSSPLSSPGGTVTENTVLWSDVGGPFYLTQQSPPVSPPAFAPTAVQAMQFQVFTNTTMAQQYSFCVANVALIPN